MTRTRKVLAAVVVALLAAASATWAGEPAPAARPTVVVAVADTGVNPYHEAFYRPGNTAHPCTWVEGFTDCSVPALPLSVGEHDDVADAFAADEHLWAAVEPHRFYWIPKTNIIGAVCDTVVGGGVSESALPPSGPVACIFDENGHGTGTASSVLSEAPDALLLVHEGNSGAYDLAKAPVTPDVQSHSWGPAAPLPLQVLRTLVDEPCPVGEARPETLVFLAAGNETPWPTLLDCQRAQPDVQVVGGGYPGYWQANSWTVYDFASWYCRPAARSTSVREQRSHCGTSFSAPTAAGTAAAALLRIRQHDGFTGRSSKASVSTSVTREAFLQALRDGASYSPRSKYPDEVPCLDPTADCYDPFDAGVLPLPPLAPYLAWGYGWLDSTVTDAVVGCALTTSCDRKAQDAATYNAQRQQGRSAAALEPLGSTRDDDGGSGRDAGEDAAEALPVVPGPTYAGGVHSFGDWGDGYALRARAGQRLTVSSSTRPGQAALTGCWSVHAPDGARLTPLARSPFGLLACDPGAAPPDGLRLPASGTYLLLYQSYVTQDYRFSLALR